MSVVRAFKRPLPVVMFVVVLIGAPARAQQVTLGQEAYLTPPKEIADAVLAARGETVTLTNLSPDGKKFLITKTDGLPPLSRMACPCVHLAEMAFDPIACRARDLWVASAESFELFFPTENRTVPVKAPAGARGASPAGSPDGSKLAFFAYFEDTTHIYIADTETGSLAPPYCHAGAGHARPIVPVVQRRETDPNDPVARRR